MHNQEVLNTYFSTVWAPGQGIQSSPETIVRSGKLTTEAVLDVGCGLNPFKKLLPNVIGIDPAFDEADVKCTIEQFTTLDRFDVIMCLGSINFGDSAVIVNQVHKVVSLCKPSARIFWRLNPGRHDHPNTECSQIPFYNWSFSKLGVLAAHYGFVQLNECTEHHDDKKRLYAEWKR